MALIITIRTGELGLKFRFLNFFLFVCSGVLFCFDFCLWFVVFPDCAPSLMMVNSIRGQLTKMHFFDCDYAEMWNMCFGPSLTQLQIPLK